MSPGGDIADTDSPWRNDAQQAYIRIMTQPGDFLIYPPLGTDFNQLKGMPQSQVTGELGKRLILTALKYGNPFMGKSIQCRAVPTGPQSIRFDVFITANARTNHILSIEQTLGVDT